MAMRRALLAGSAVLAATSGGVFLAAFRRGEYELGAARLIPPLLRAPLGQEDRVFALVRRREREILPALSMRSADAGERLELWCWKTETLEPVFAAPLLSIPTGGFRDAAILGIQGPTIWVFAGGLGAASAVDGRMLADQQGMLERGQSVARMLSPARANFRFEERLLIRTGASWDYSVDPVDFRVLPLTALPRRQELAARVPAAWHSGGLAGLRQLRLEPQFFALLDGAATGPDSARPARPPAGAAPTMRLWRAMIRPAEPPAPEPPPASVPGKPGVPPLPPPPRRPAAAPAERLVEHQEIAVEPAPLHDAAILTDGRDAIRPGEPGGLLLLYRAEAGGPFRLARVGLDGAVAWRAELPLDRVQSVLPGGGTLLLAGQRAGAGADKPEAIVALDLASGAVRARDLSVNAAVSA